MAYSCCGSGVMGEDYESQNYLGLVSYGRNLFSPARYNGNFGTRRYQTPHSWLEKKAYEAPKMTPLGAGAEYSTRPVRDIPYSSSNSGMPTTLNMLDKYLRGEVSPAPLWYHPSVLDVLNGRSNYGGANAVPGNFAAGAGAKTLSAATPCRGRC